MGNKTLAQYLDVSEMEAAAFMDSFYNTYPAVRRFTQSVIDDCRSKGYVETLTKRRRYLPHINSNVLYKKGAAERQAVNTTIQGSAADIAKAAMCAIDTKTSGSAPQPRLILQMHDELIYEVLESNKNSFIAVLKQVMEETVKLRVPLPVKVKTGPTWVIWKKSESSKHV
ncbi:DNA polymerase I-like [Manduca sexta]|uniref:DNA polymerase I-like n=1 Tax=Manduca sexta TaxID=7130 RepID=UPI00188E81CD|nr:DNA polymerase I-like [Manduca sexta]